MAARRCQARLAQEGVQLGDQSNSSTKLTRGRILLRTRAASSCNIPSRRPVPLPGILSCLSLRGGACLRAGSRHRQPANVAASANWKWVRFAFRETRSSSSQKRSEPAAHPCRGPGGQAGDEHGGPPWSKGTGGRGHQLCVTNVGFYKIHFLRYWTGVR